jgi:hypothetical protein
MVDAAVSGSAERRRRAKEVALPDVFSFVSGLDDGRSGDAARSDRRRPCSVTERGIAAKLAICDR